MWNKLTLPFLLSLLLSCGSSSNISNQKTTNDHSMPTAAFDKEGHRGCRGLMPENTIPAMLYAIGLGVTTLEMDVVYTKDGKIILSHEPFFNHEISTKPDGSYIKEPDEKSYNIFKMNYIEVLAYDVGMKVHPRFPDQQKIKAVKPLLSDVFTAVKTDMMTRRRPFPFYNIETKTTDSTDNIFHPAPAAFVDGLMQVIKENDMEDFVIIQSFDMRTLQYLHTHYPAIPTSLLVNENDNEDIDIKIKRLGFIPTILSPHYSLVTEKLLEKWHALHRKVIPFTVNDLPTINRLKKMGVDGIISDYPNLLNE